MFNNWHCEKEATEILKTMVSMFPKNLSTKLTTKQKVNIHEQAEL